MGKPAAQPFFIHNVQEVDDAGGQHYECVLSGRALMTLLRDGQLTQEGNIRPDHQPDQKPKAKTRQKIDQWARELTENDAVIGNLSIRLNPDKCHYELVESGDGLDLKVNRGHLDCAVDSLSRIKAIEKAAHSAAQTFDLDTRFSVRIWVLDDEDARRVGTLYNTRGDKVNDSTAKFAYSATQEQRMARELMMGSSHLGQDNVETLANTVSASSHRLCAFNTLSKAMEDSWTHEAIKESDEKQYVDYLINFWDALVAVRPEFGRLTKIQRQQLRGASVAGTAVSIHGVIAVADALWDANDVPSTDALVAKLKPLQSTVKVESREVDYFSYDNPKWEDLGILVKDLDKSGNVKKTLRMSFQTRSKMQSELRRQLGL